jgi:hypothetical protein
MERCIEKASEELPTGYRIILEVENGWAGCKLIYPNGNQYNLNHNSNWTFKDQIKEGLRVANHVTKTYKRK